MYDPRHPLWSLKFSKTTKATVRYNWPDRRLPPQTSNCCYVKHKCHLLIINFISDLFKVKIIYQMFRHIFQTGACRNFVFEHNLFTGCISGSFSFYIDLVFPNVPRVLFQMFLVSLDFLYLFVDLGFFNVY